jgi:hypothetical protein
LEHGADIAKVQDWLGHANWNLPLPQLPTAFFGDLKFQFTECDVSAKT